MDHHDDWGNWGEDYSGDADTADLADPDEPIAGGLGGYDGSDDGSDPGGYPAGDAGAEPGGGHDPSAGGGFLEDDPMGGLDGDPDGADSGADVGVGHLADADAGPAEPYGDDPYADPDAAGEPHPETVVGADPDVDPAADWSPADFPEQLDFAAPEPVDGYPWSDPSAVAAPGTGGEDPADGPASAPPAQDLLDYAGADGGTDPWAALVGSDDPATSSLGRWWAPGT